MYFYIIMTDIYRHLHQPMICFELRSRNSSPNSKAIAVLCIQKTYFFCCMNIIRVFICFWPPHSDSQCESQKLNSHQNINYQSHLSHKCHGTNHVIVFCDMFKTLEDTKVSYFNISLSFVTHIVTHNVRDQSRWIPY